MMRFYEELEEILIMADLGTKTTFKFMDKLKKRVKEENIFLPPTRIIGLIRN